MAASRTVIKTVASADLVFGLDWFAILGGTVTRELRRLVRQHKATHAVYSGDEAACAGLLSLARPDRGRLLYSAAQLVARRFPTGVVAMMLPLDADRWWFVAVHDGAVIARTDQVCDSAEEAYSLIPPLRQAYPGLELLDDDSGRPSLDELANARGPDAALRPVSGTRPAKRWQQAALVLLLGALIYKVAGVAGLWGSGQSASGASVDPHVAWQAAIQAAASTRWVHGVAGTAQLLQALYALPVKVEGWGLQQATCRADRNTWQCQADYRRADDGASNRGFLGAAPDSWRVEFTPLEQARGHWRFDAAGLGGDHAMLPDAAHTEREIFSMFQRIRPAFSRMVIEAPRVLPVVAPVDPQGQPLAAPGGLPRFHARNLQLQAPLRSLNLLLPHCEAVFWQTVTLDLASRARPDLTSSRLNVTLQGVLYEQD